MLKKIGSFFEEHVEKIVLVIIGIICALLFIWRVLFSPNMVEYVNDEGNKVKLSPDVIDDYVYQDTLQLSQKQSGPPPDTNSYEPKIKEYLAVLDSSIRNIDTDQIIPNPEIVTPTIVTRGQYNLPYIGNVTVVESEHIRAAAYVPIEPITEMRTYEQVEHEPNDIDFVSVEGKFDIAGLYDRFHECFVDQVEEQWADPCLAKPIFASINLQRRELKNDGTWSSWQNVPRPIIDHNKRLLNLIQEGNKLPPGGLKLQMLQFDNKQLQIELLQPNAYQFASAREDWFPPSLHRDYVSAVKKEIQQEKREAREAELEERSRETSERRSSRTGSARGAGGGMYEGIGDVLGGQGRRTGGRSRRTSGRETGFADSGRGTARGQRSRGRRGGDSTMMEMERYIGESAPTMEISPINKVYREFNKIQIDWNTDLSEMREPLVFWAHDDTVETEKSYQYRIRLGVFNPVAQGDQEDVILWSEFSDVTDTIEIPGKLYFFVNSIQETAKTVTVTVYKYFLGYWRSEDFRGIGPGEAIGGIVEYEPEEPEEQPFIAGGQGRFGAPMVPMTTAQPEEPTVEPESINFDTGAVVVDVVTVNEWVTSDNKNLSNKSYHDMLYSYDGTKIEHVPVSSSYWPEDMRKIFAKIQRLSREEKEPFKAFSSRGVMQRPGMDSMRGGESDDMYQEMMMMEQMRRQ